MKEYTSCFIGIPLPDEYLENFANSLETVKIINPNLEIVDPATPHTTIYYLGSQPESNLNDVEDVIKQHVHLIRNTRLTVAGIDTFGKEVPTVLFLPVDKPQQLEDFANIVSKEVAKFIEDDNNLSFHPHMTVAYFNPASQSSWEKIKTEIEKEVKKIEWNFPITEVVIYGTESPTEQFKKASYKKLISIPVF